MSKPREVGYGDLVVGLLDAGDNLVALYAWKGAQ